MVAAEAAISLLGFLVLLDWIGGGGAQRKSNSSLAIVALFLGLNGCPRLKKSVMRQLLLALAFLFVFGGRFGGAIFLLIIVVII